MPQKSWVNLGFYQGAQLENLNNLLEGTGKSLRHIKVRSLDMVADENLKTLVTKAVALRKA